MIIHKSFADGRWYTFSLFDQLGNVGTDVERAINWKKRGETDDSEKALVRGLELLDLTIKDPKNKNRRKELFRIKEALLDYFYGNNQYGFTDEAWQQYFYCYAYASAIQKGR
ncbi:MAG: hypothetical protein AB7F19_02635 [Candidatus Babeliales bacterium]